MTRRIGLAILISVWAMLVIGAVAAYVSVRSILIADLDSLLFARASALPELSHGEGFDPHHTPQYDWADSYVIQPDAARPPAEGPDRPTMREAHFARAADGKLLRTVVVAATAAPPHGGEPETPVIVEYSGSMARITSLLSRLRLALAGFVLVAGVIAAGVAMGVSRLVLRPVGSTARLIDTIDERKLSARVPVSGLPSEFVPVAQRLNELLDRLERAFSGQKQFVADTSHELRTPVAALATTLEIAGRQPREAESYRQTIAQCLAQVQVLQLLIERLMDYVSGGAADEKPQNIDVGAMLCQCLDTAEALGSANQITLTRAGPRSLWCSVPAVRLRSVLMNLLGNAVEYNRAGGQVEVSWIHDGQQLRVRIADNGPGIAPEHLPHLFNPFYRVEKSRSQRGGHLGLGLFIVQSHLKAMGGACHVDSTPGEGTVFEIELLCSKSPEPARETDQSTRWLAPAGSSA